MTDFREIQKEAAASAAYDWTMNQLNEGNDPSLEEFLAQFPLFDTKTLREIAGREMFNAKNGLPYTGKAVQGA